MLLNKILTAKASKPASEATIRFAELALPISEDQPCGPDLEYDTEFVVLQARATPREAAQYGDFVAPTEALNWPELERDCQRLLLRTKDIRLLTLFLRCRTRLDQAEGLRDGLALLHAVLTAFPEQVHPQLEIDGEVDPGVRANALATLVDPQGLLADVREIALGRNAIRLQVRDIERALGMSRPADALAPESVHQQLEAFRGQGLPEIESMHEACALAQSIQLWTEASLPDHAPDLKPLIWLLQLVGHPGRAKPVAVEFAPATEIPPVAAAAPSSLSTNVAPFAQADVQPASTENVDDMPTSRHAALTQIRLARTWFEAHEPSSPVALLLRQAESMVGKPFAKVFQAIPADLVERWAQNE
ncbi:type VI secretion system protein TssA [Ralstonia sp. GX3-BWBA]|uniref:type VI secretion system protein TssA n=1 Tax=Ralstonia sp. GX3-BWBA TaxID=2219865 RepID=UPI000DD2C55B|nr:type VI secretion system protein TssA [Ralstonia sp. GX3-BWBA]